MTVTYGTLPVHQVGGERKLSATLCDDTNTLIDPTALTFTMTEPDGVVTTYTYKTDVELVRDSLGVFHVDWDCTKLGLHMWSFAATGNVDGVAAAEFLVETLPVETGWPIDQTCLPDLPAADDPTYVEAVAARSTAEALAVQVLWALSGRQFGVIDTTVRPCVPTVPWWCRTTNSGVTSYVLSWEGDKWVSWWCGCTGSWCRLTGLGAVHLPGPVREILKVTIANSVLASDQYIVEGDVLYRTGEQTVWPRQNLARPLGEPNTWSVEFLRGQSVPAGVDRLTAQLANEFLALCSGAKCRLPSTVISTDRQGVSHVFDPSRMFELGKTGLIEIDRWLAAVNPHKLMQPPSVI